MPTIDEAVYAIAQRVRELKPLIETEEATKTAFIIPFIQDVLGYDVTDPREVIPEYTADVGVKKGEKVDFAIKSGDSFRFIIECKKIGEPLSVEHASQLVRYFNLTDTEFAILTNGEVYQFYTQLDAENRMDQTPFMILDMTNIDERVFQHLEMCTKQQFDASTILESAEKLKYVTEVRRVLADMFNQPDEEWIKEIACRVTSRRMTHQTVEFFTKIVTIAQTQFLNDEANRRLRSAQTIEETACRKDEDTDAGEEGAPVSDIETTIEEIEGFSIIRAIGCSEVPASDINMRDAKSYCSVLYQDNNRQTIARLYFNNLDNLKLAVLNPDETKSVFNLDIVEDIYKYADLIRERIQFLAANS